MTDRWKRAVPPAAGVLLVAVTVVGISLGSTPGAGASGTKVLAYVNSHHGRQWVECFLFAYAALLAVVFYAGMSSYLRRRGSDVLATLTVVGGALIAAGMALGAGATAALADKTSKLSPDAAQALNQVNEDIFFIALFAGLVLATLSMGISMLRTKAMPKALGIITVIVGIGAVSGIGAWFAFMASGPLTLAIAWFLYQRAGQPDEITLPEVPEQRAEAPAAPRRARAKA